MTYKVSKLNVLLILCCFLFSCKQLLDVDPTGSIDAEGSLNSKETLTAMANGSYSYLRSTALYGEEYIVYPEIQADNAVQSGRTSNLVSVADNNVGSGLDGWHQAYEGIVQINVTLEALRTFEAPQEWKDALAGQLYFLRALYYHNLARTFGYDPTAVIASSDRGTVPMILKGVVAVDDIDYKGRMSIDSMYTQLYSDLDSAYALLANTAADRAPHFATQGAVAALYSRIALYNGDYQKVVEQADMAIASHIATLSTHDSYVADWRQETHPESMFEVMFTKTENIGVNNSIHSMFTTHASAAEPDLLKGNGYAVVSDGLYNLYEDNDVRKELIWSGLGGNADKHEMTKFLSRGGDYGLDNVPVIRLSEVYLNRAEAYAHIPGDENLAIADLNTIRERAGLDPLYGLSEETLINAILLQRRLELAFEGDRWFTLKRLGEDVIKPDGTVMPFSDYRILSRVPFREVNANPSLRQNRGY